MKVTRYFLPAILLTALSTEAFAQDPLEAKFRAAIITLEKKLMSWGKNFRELSEIEVEGIVVGRKSDMTALGGPIEHLVKATITVHCPDGRTLKGTAEYNIQEDAFGEMVANWVPGKVGGTTAFCRKVN